MNEIDPRTAIEGAATHASMLLSAGALPEGLAGLQVEPDGTPVHDLDGEVLFHRVRVGRRGEDTSGYLDVGVHPAMAAPLVAIAPDAEWDPGRLVEEAGAAWRRRLRRPVEHDEARIVAYSYPKLAVQFLRRGEEVAMVELFTGAPVPEARRREKGEPPGELDRWSFIDELTPAQQRRRATAYQQTTGDLIEMSRRFDHERLVIQWIDISDILRLHQTRDLRYSRRSGAHQVCYELRGQETNVWCVAASVQMVLDFYRYEYSQTRLATELGLGTRTNPNGLPYANDSLVVDVLEAMSSGALDATMYTTNPFSRFRTEINANRPLISFIPGHSRTVAGYTDTSWMVLTGLGFQGLCVYDPWPPNAGVVTRWENFATSTYRRTFTARVTLA